MSAFLSIVGSSLRNVPDLEPTVGCFCVSSLWHFLILSSILLIFFFPSVNDLLILLILDFRDNFLLELSGLWKFCITFFSLLILGEKFICGICRILREVIVLTCLTETSGVLAASNKFLRKLGEPWYILLIAAALLRLAAVELSKDLEGFVVTVKLLCCTDGETFFILTFANQEIKLLIYNIFSNIFIYM